MKNSACALLLLVALAGCTQAPVEQDIPSIDWQPLDVHTQAVEPFEFQGFLRIGWQDGRTAIDAEMEPDLPRFLVRDGDTAYTTRQGIGWTRWDLDAAMEDGRLSNRLLLWDLPSLLADPRSAVTVDDRTIEVEGVLSHGGRPLEVNATIHLDNDRVTEAHVASPQGRESPFVFTPAEEPLSRPIVVPSESRTPTEIDAMDAEVRHAHVQIIQWIQDHQARRAGTLPERIDQDSLHVERTLDQEPWPLNPYTGRPMEQGDGSGDIRWKRCTETSGIYMGLGWDLSVVGESFGASCRFA